MKAKQTEKLIALFTEMWTCWHLGQGFSPHTVIHIVVIESDEKSQDSEKDDYVGRDNQTRWSPHDLKERKKTNKGKYISSKTCYVFFLLLTTGVNSGALARIMGRPKADTTMTAVMNMAISRQGFVFPVPSPYLREMTTGKGANR